MGRVGGGFGGWAWVKVGCCGTEREGRVGGDKMEQLAREGMGQGGYLVEFGVEWWFVGGEVWRCYACSLGRRLWVLVDGVWVARHVRR
jgi:hypothetical protein